jgi:phage gp29-like protein
MNLLPKWANLAAKSNKANQPVVASKTPSELFAKIVQQMVFRSSQDMNNWKYARTNAEHQERPRRLYLQRLYDDILLDSHLSGIVMNRKLKLQSESFKIESLSDGKENRDLTKLFNTSWFYEFINHCMDTHLHGHSLIEFQILNDKIDMALIPRWCVIPEQGKLLMDYSADKMIDYRDGSYNLVEIGKPNDFGLLFKAALLLLHKKNVVQAWAEYCEIFGMPIRIGKVASRTPTDRSNMETFLKQMGKAPYAVADIGDEIEIKESSKGDAYQVYMQFINTVNSEISKLIHGQTMTSDNGSSRSQSEVHEKTAEDYLRADMRFTQFIINDNLIPLLIKMGYNTELANYQFVWERKDEITDTDIAQDTMLLQNFEFENYDSFANKYNVPIKGIKAAAQQTKTEPAAKEPKAKKAKAKLQSVQNLSTQIQELYKPHQH